MKFQVLMVVLVCVCIPSINADDELTEFTKPIEEPSFSSKIQPILIQWQQAENQNEFAKNNNLPLVDEKVKIYIYLDGKDSKEKLPPEITITGSDGNIVGALVSPDQLDKLDKLDFVQKVAIPVLAVTPPIPKTENQENNTSTEKEFGYLTWVLILGIILILVILAIKKSMTFKAKKK